MSDLPRDRRRRREPLSHETVWRGRVFSMEEDRVSVVEGAAPVVRQYVAHPGAVAVVALRGEEGHEEVLLERQYRHPVGAELWEVPAGLLDVPGEPPLEAARRELSEEVDLAAQTWHVLVDFFTSPGGSTEALRVFLARDVHPTGTVFPREDEEATMEHLWLDLDEAVGAVLDGRIHNPSAVVGILAAHTCRARAWSGLRPVTAPWMR